MRFSHLQGIAPWIVLALLLLLSSFSPATALDAQSLTDFHLQWAWSASGSAIGSAGFEILDLDNDGRHEILATAEASQDGGYWYTLERRQGNLVQTFSSLPFEGGMIDLSVVHEGGRTRMVVTGRNSIKLIDGASQVELASYPTLTDYHQDAAAADVDADGILDVVVCDESDLYVYELLTGTARVKYGFGCQHVLVGQTDDDPQLEIVLAGNSAGGFVLDGLSLTVDWADLRGFGSRVVLGDFDADGREEVASLMEGDQGVRVQDPHTGGLLWEASTPRIVALAAGNIDIEPGDELAYALELDGPTYIVDGATPAALRTFPDPPYGIQALALGDVDDDGVADIAWAAGQWTSAEERVYLASTDSTAVEAMSTALPGPFPGMAVGDFSGDGSREVATVSAGTSFSLGGTALVLALDRGRLLRWAPQTFPQIFGENVYGLAGGQLDDDNALEICLGTNGTVGCLDGANFAEQWRVALPQYQFLQALRLGELDGDLAPEVLAGSHTYVYAYEGESGWLKWRSPEPANADAYIRWLEAVDLEGDASQEVVAGASRWNGAWISTFESDSGLLSAGPWTVDLEAMVKVPGGAPAEPIWIAKAGGSIVAFDPLTGIEGSQVANFPQTARALGVGDLTRDGVLDIVALLSSHLQVQDGQSGLTIWESPYLVFADEPKDSLLVGDFDENGVPEILVATQYGIVKFEAPLFQIFADGFESGDTSNW